MAERPNLGGIIAARLVRSGKLRLRRAPETRGFCDKGGVSRTRQLVLLSHFSKE